MNRRSFFRFLAAAPVGVTMGGAAASPWATGMSPSAVNDSARGYMALMQHAIAQNRTARVGSAWSDRWLHGTLMAMNRNAGAKQ